MIIKKTKDTVVAAYEIVDAPTILAEKLKPVAERLGLAVSTQAEPLVLIVKAVGNSKSEEPDQHQARTIHRPRVDSTTAASIEAGLRQAQVSLLRAIRKDRADPDDSRSLRAKTLNNLKRLGAARKAASRNMVIGIGDDAVTITASATPTAPAPHAPEA